MASQENQSLEPTPQSPWKKFLSWIPRLVIMAGIVLILLVQDPCGCGMANHYRLSWQDSELLVELAPGARDLLNGPYLTSEIQRQVEMAQGKGSIQVSFYLMAGYENDFQKSHIQSFPADPSGPKESLALQITQILDTYRHPKKS
jgi:hypothetical protein